MHFFSIFLGVGVDFLPQKILFRSKMFKTDMYFTENIFIYQMNANILVYYNYVQCKNLAKVEIE